MNMSTIEFDKETLEELKQDYAAAVRRGADSFFFEDAEMVVEYAYYLIQYLEMKFK